MPMVPRQCPQAGGWRQGAWAVGCGLRLCLGGLEEVWAGVACLQRLLGRSRAVCSPCAPPGVHSSVLSPSALTPVHPQSMHHVGHCQSHLLLLVAVS